MSEGFLGPPKPPLGRDGSLAQVAPELDIADAQAIADFLKAEIGAVLDLSSEEIGVHISFADLGLTSTDALDLLGKVEDEVGRTIDVADFYQYPTIHALSVGLTSSFDGVGDQAEQTQERDGGIAIIGMGCRYPRAQSPRQLWQLFADGVDVIGSFPGSRRCLPGAEATRRQGGYLDDVTGFDAAFFGIAPDEARHMDPMQRLLLEIAVEALDDAGVDPSALDGQRCGVVLGVSGSEFALASLTSTAAIVRSRLTGSAPSFCANRLSYFFDWSGPSIVIDTACSSAATAVQLACDLLTQGTVDLVITGGANLILSDQIGDMLDSMGALSTTERCMTMDARANGYVRGEGIGLVVLKRSVDAWRDRDRVYAQVTGWATNNDGKSNGITAPNGRAQKEIVSRASAMAGIAPSRIDFFELHGTGTALGDPIEVNALSDIVGLAKGDAHPVLMGSAKTNLGHLEAASGIAGIHKAALALYHGIVPPTLHFKNINEKIAIAGTALQPAVQSCELRPGRRFGGVSSFGIGGTNTHVVLSNVPPQSRTAERTDMPLLLSGQTPSALAAFARECAAMLAAGANPYSFAFSLACRRRHYAQRAVVPMRGQLDELVDAVLSITGDEGGAANLGMLDGDDALVASVHAWCEGQAPDFSVFYPVGGNFTSYPPYPFARSTFWPWEEKSASERRPDRNDATGHQSEGSQTETISFDREVVHPIIGKLPHRRRHLLLHDSKSRAFAESVERSLRIAFPDVTIRRAHLDDADFQSFVDEDPANAGLVFVSDERTSDPSGGDVLPDYGCYHEAVCCAAAANLEVPCSLLLAPASGWANENAAPTAPLAALIRTLRLEIPRLAGAVIFAMSEKAVPPDTILDILENPAEQNTDVIVDDYGAFNLVPRRHADEGDFDRVDVGFDRDHAVALSGGTGGLGLVFAEWALESGAGEVLLISRNPDVVKDQPRFKELLAFANIKGAAVKLIACDVSDAPALRQAVGSVPHLPVSTIVHLAGIPCGGAIRTVPQEAIESATRVKLQGAIALETVFDSPALKCYIAVSSPAARLGLYSQGGVGYAVANAALESYMASRGERHAASLVMEWGPWRDIGMVARSPYASELEAAGIVLIESADALSALRVGRFCFQQPYLIVGAGSAVFSKNELSPAQTEVALGRELRLLPLSERVPTVAAYLRAKVAGVLESGADEIDSSADLASIGLDSINAIDMKIEIEEQLGVEISFHALLDGATIDGLARTIAARIQDQSGRQNLNKIDGPREAETLKAL